MQFQQLKQISRILVIAAMLVLALAGCSCSGKKSDDEAARLKKKIDVTPVHLYASVKLALSSPDADPALKKAVDEMLVFLATGDFNNLKTLRESLSIGDLMILGKAVLSLKGAGQEIVQGKRDEGAPVIRRLLLLLNAPAQIADLFNRSTDHAMLFLTEASLKFHEKSPVPVPEEVILYEAWRTDPSALTIPGMDALVYGLRAYFYGKNDFCILATNDAEAAERSTENAEALLRGIGLISEGAVQGNLNDIKPIVLLIRILGNSGPALCYYNRGDDKAARSWLKAILDDVKASGIAGDEETAELQIFFDCGGDDVETAQGMAALAKLPPPANDTAKIDRQLLDAYCQASAETKFEIARKISLSAKLLKIALKEARNSKAAEGLEKSRAYRAAFSIAVLCEKAAASSSSASNAMEKLTGFKALFKKE